MREIKYYRNRKLYDTIESRYTNLTEIVTMIKNNEDFYVVHKDTQQDVTARVLTEALQLVNVPVGTLKDLINKSEVV